MIHGKDGIEHLDMLKTLDTRTVLRITLIRNYNDQKEMIPAFAEMFKKLVHILLK